MNDNPHYDAATVTRLGRELYELAVTRLVAGDGEGTVRTDLRRELVSLLAGPDAAERIVRTAMDAAAQSRHGLAVAMGGDAAEAANASAYAVLGELWFETQTAQTAAPAARPAPMPTGDFVEEIKDNLAATNSILDDIGRQLGLPHFAALPALQAGGIGVLPTDTLYGLVARAADAMAVERIFVTKGRDTTKPLIILISDVAQLAGFGVTLNAAANAAMERYWPGPVSLIVPTIDPDTEYLHRGTGALAFRLPDDPGLRGLIEAVGPLVAPSANPQGEPPAVTIDEARAYFGDAVDFYVDVGHKAGKPSTLLRLGDDGTIETLRP